MEWITFVGLAAATCTTISLLPQAIKIIKIKETRDISLLMYLILDTGLVLWLTYGILIRDVPVIAANAISLVIATIIIFLKLKYG